MFTKYRTLLMISRKSSSSDEFEQNLWYSLTVYTLYIYWEWGWEKDKNFTTAQCTVHTRTSQSYVFERASNLLEMSSTLKKKRKEPRWLGLKGVVWVISGQVATNGFDELLHGDGPAHEGGPTGGTAGNLSRKSWCFDIINITDLPGWNWYIIQY